MYIGAFACIKLSQTIVYGAAGWMLCDYIYNRMFLDKSCMTDDDCFMDLKCCRLGTSFFCCSSDDYIYREYAYLYNIIDKN